MGDVASRPADRTRLAWQRSLLLILATAAVLFKDASDDGQSALGGAAGGVLLVVALGLYWTRGRHDDTGEPAPLRAAPAAQRLAAARALLLATLLAAGVSLLIIALTI
jgi:hypothetical protein